MSEGTWFVVLTAAATQNANQAVGTINCTINTASTQHPVMNFTLFESDIESPSSAIVVTTNGVDSNTVKADCGGGSSDVTFSALTLTATRVTTVFQP